MIRDYIELCKPRVVALMILTSLVGMCLATPEFVPWKILLFGNLGIAFAAGSAACVNHVADQHIDSLMHRTKKRPIPTGNIHSRSALLFAFFLGATGLTLLLFFTNTLTAALTFFSIIAYAGIYTFYLKHATPQNIVIGGLSGATPPLLGWVAVTGQVNALPLILVLIIFSWTPPHFWALAIAREKEYQNAKVPMLPNVYGVAYTKNCIIFYTILLFAVTLLPYAINAAGLAYLIPTCLLNLQFLHWTIRLKKSNNLQVAMQTFRYSITYLMLLFTALLVDHYWKLIN